MAIGHLLPAALAMWKPRQTQQSMGVQVSRPLATSVRNAPTGAAALPREIAADIRALPHGMAAVAPETQTVLTKANEIARRRLVELQMAMEPNLVVQVEAVEYRTCLNRLVLDAIGRASSGVLVTAIQQSDNVEIAVLDDGADLAAARHDGARQDAGEIAIPAGGTLVAEYHPERGTTILLRLPQGGHPVARSDADAGDRVEAAFDL